VLVIKDPLGGNDFRGVSATCDYVGHDGDEGVFFDVERAGVEGPGVAKGGDVCAREGLLEEFTGGEGDELGDKGSDLDGWIWERWVWVGADQRRGRGTYIAC
jgi:hypothetical protein